MADLILASGSERRHHLLQRLGLRFRMVDPQAVERFEPGLCTELAIQLVARMKAQQVAEQLRGEDAYIIAADTIVVGPTGPLGKPGTAERAREMLTLLRGQRHTVLTGVCTLAVRTGAERMGVSRAAVRMRDFDDGELDHYVAGGEPLDKAGGYAVQGLGGALVDAVAGRMDTVIGLDCQLAVRLLTDVGYPNPLPTAPDWHLVLGKTAATRRPLASASRSGLGLR
ncbi:MAG TPA: Maf family protein [Candidatus Micrarchaeia archaeon]|nr:Maf family protein [Candidatus Micrarchaeia archaeon]